MMEFKEKIKELRSQKKITQEQLAIILRVSRKTISSWENGHNYPDIQTLISISDFFEVSLDTLLRGDQEMTNKLDELVHLNKKDLFFFKISYVLVLILTVLSYLTSILNYPISGWIGFVYVVSVIVLMSHLPVTLQQIKVWCLSLDHLLLLLLVLLLTLFINFQEAMPIQIPSGVSNSSAFVFGYFSGFSIGSVIQVVSVAIILLISPKRVYKLN